MSGTGQQQSGGNNGDVGFSRPTHSNIGPARDPWNNVIRDDGQNNRNEYNQQAQNDGNKNKNNQNDTGINDDDIENLWSDVKKGGNPNDGNNQQQQSNNQQQPQVPTEEQREAQITSYLQNIGLEPITLNDTLKAELAEGNFEGLVNQFNQKIRNAHMKAMSGAKALMDNMASDIKTQAENSATSTFMGQMAMNELHRQVPEAKDKVLGPVLQTVMQKLINKGANTEQAVLGVKQFIKRMRGSNNDNVNNNPNSGFRQNGPGNNGGDSDWLSVLSGQSR